MKFDNDSHLVIKRKIEEQIDEYGNKHILVKKEIPNKPVNLDSMKNPMNTDIIEVKYIIKERNRNYFGGFLR